MWLKCTSVDCQSPALVALKTVDNVVDDLVNRRVNLNNDWMLVLFRFFERSELTIQQPRRHKVIFARRKPACDQFPVAPKIDDSHVLLSVHQDISISSFQRGAGYNEMFAQGALAVDLGRNGLKPRPAILIGEGVAPAHLLNVGFRMKTVPLLKGPLQSLGETGRDCAFTGSRYSNDDERKDWRGNSFIAHAPSPRRRWRRSAVLSQRLNPHR